MKKTRTSELCTTGFESHSKPKYPPDNRERFLEIFQANRTNIRSLKFFCKDYSKSEHLREHAARLLNISYRTERQLLTYGKAQEWI